MSSNLWRILFLLGGVLLSIGGSQHPDGTIEQMLADPGWPMSHALVVAGFACFLAGLMVFGASRPLPASSRRWLRIAIVGLALQTLEMAVHTAAYVDLDALRAGQSTPVLTTHLWMTQVIYPIFAITAAGFAVVAARDRVLGSQWIAWLGIAGALAHGTAGLLVPVLDIAWARNLFPLIMLYALWAMLVAVWPVRTHAAAAASSAQAASR